MNNASFTSSGGATWTVTPGNRHVACRLRGKRRALALSCDAVASAIGVGCDQVEAYETGAVSVPPEHLQLLSQYLDVPVSYFLPETPRRAP